MISLVSYDKPAENPEIVSLVYFSMRNRYTSVSDPAGLTFKEVREILSNQSVTAIQDGDRIVGILRVSEVTFQLRHKMGLPNEVSYQNLGLIYIAKNERGNGYASQVVEQCLKEHKNLIYVVHKSNVASNKIAKKYFTFFKEDKPWRAVEAYNIYKIEQ